MPIGTATLRHVNNLPFSLRVSFVPFVSLWFILFEPQRHKDSQKKSAIIGIVQYILWHANHCTLFSLLLFASLAYFAVKIKDLTAKYAKGAKSNLYRVAV